MQRGAIGLQRRALIYLSLSQGGEDIIRRDFWGMVMPAEF